MASERTRLIFLLVLTAIVLLLCLLMARTFLKPAVFATLIAIVFYPLHIRILKLFRRRNLAALVSTLLVMLGVIFIVFVLGRAISGELRDLYQLVSTNGAAGGKPSLSFTNSVQRVVDWLAHYVNLGDFDLKTALRTGVHQAISLLPAFAARMAGNVASLAFNSAVAFFALFFFFRDGSLIRRRLVAILPLGTGQSEELVQKMNDTLIANVYGVVAVAFAQGSLTGIAFWALGLTSPILWGTVTGIFSVVPVVGSAAVWGPAAVILMLSGSWWKGAILLAWGAGVVSLVDQFVRPWVVGGRMRQNTLAVFFSLLGGVEAFGISGIFIGPVVLSVALALFDILSKEQRARGLAWQTRSADAEIPKHVMGSSREK